jgi:TRAP transporter TAXI family solute receptor
VLLVGLGACGRGPDVDRVIGPDLAARLAQAFGAGVLDIVAIDGRGSSADRGGPPGEERRVAYYDARLRLARDVDFGGWDTPGVASLVSVLGAGPKGVTGVKAGGNKAGDEILAHGTAVYRRDGEAWREVAPAGFAPPEAPASGTISPPPASERLLDALRDAVHAAPAGTTPATRAVIDQELARALATIEARLARLAQGYPVAAGPDGGQYVRFVQALQAAAPTGLTFEGLLTAGSVENLDLLREGRVPLALTQADAARQAAAGEGAFARRGPFPELRALGSLFPEPLHVIVRADSPAGSVRDLTHKRIGLGPDGSGTRETAERVLAAYGMEAGRDYEPDAAPLSAALVALGGGTLDAVVQVIGVPADQVRTATASVPLRLLPVDETVLAELTAQDPALLRGVIPKDTYPGVDRDVPTVAVSALLATTAALGEAEARSVVEAVFGAKADLVANGSAQGAQVGVATARSGIPIPLAAGAEAALASLAAAR